jgi:peptidoglycan/LPS O-acetylase OafA/YrhL
LIQDGQQAVTFFFVLSGFILTYSYFQPENLLGLRTSRKDFWIARVARIYPVYALALLLAIVPIVHGTFVTHTIPMPQFVGAILCCPILLQAWIPPIALGWNGPAWSLSVGGRQISPDHRAQNGPAGHRIAGAGDGRGGL